MSGRPKQQIYMYGLNGKYIGKFDSKSDFRKAYFPDDIGARPLLTMKERIVTPRINEVVNYHIIDDETVIFDRRVYRDDIRLLVKIHYSEYCKKSDSKHETPIEVLNLKGEVIATYRNLRILTKLLPHIPTGTIHSQLEKRTGCKSYTSTGLFFRYKE